jgi:hypothetical protein
MARTVKTDDPYRAFFERRHPEFANNLAHWLFLEQTYRGGRAWFASNIHKYFKEGVSEFAERLNRAYRFNHTREAVDLVQKYLFKSPVARKTDGVPQAILDFWKNATLSGLTIDQLMRTVSTGSSIGGRVALVVDTNNPGAVPVEEGAAPRPLSQKEAKDANIRIYAYMVPTKHILDYAYDEDGDGGLLWVKLKEVTRDDADPIHNSGLVLERVRLWTRTGWQLFEEQEVQNGKRVTKVIKMIEQGEHKLGRVPVILVDHMLGDNPYLAPGLIDDIAYLDRAVANYLSNLDAIIQDQTFSQLAIPAQAMMPGDEAYNKVLELGTKRVFAYDGGAGSTAKPEYISPDPKQATVILSVINKIINEIYHTIGLAGERTKEDNAVGIDNSSGVAKAYDFERVNSLLLSKAESNQKAENELVRLVCAWADEDAPKDDLVTYPTTFDVMRLADDLMTAEALAKLAAPKEVRREQMKIVVDKLFPQLATDLRTTLLDGIDEWLEGEELLLNPPSGFGQKSAAAPSRQGQVTDKTA